MTGDQPQQTTTTTPTASQQALIDQTVAAAQQFAATPLKAYPGETVAGFTPLQTQAQGDIVSGAGTAGNVADWARTGATTTLPATIAANTGTPFVAAPSVTQSSNIFNDPGIWNPANNAGVQSAIEAAQRPTWQALTDTALPAVRSGAGAVGGYGGSRQGIAEGLALSRGTQTAADQASKIAEDVYGANLAAVNQRYGTNIGASEAERQADTAAGTARYATDASRSAANINALLATYGLAPSLQQQALVPGYTEANVGDVQQQQNQAVLNEALQKYNFNMMAPAEKAQLLAAIAGGLPGGTTTTTANTPSANPVSSALGGAAVGATVGGVPGAVVGGGAGAVLPFLFK